MADIDSNDGGASDGGIAALPPGWTAQDPIDNVSLWADKRLFILSNRNYSAGIGEGGQPERVRTKAEKSSRCCFRSVER